MYVNNHVLDLNSGTAPGDRYVLLAFQEANAAVDRAVNATIASLYTRNSTSRSPSSLMRLLRFPDTSTRSIAKAAEVYERTLVNIRKHIQSGLKVNLSQGDFVLFDYFFNSNLCTYKNTLLLIINLIT